MLCSKMATEKQTNLRQIVSAHCRQLIHVFCHFWHVMRLYIIGALVLLHQLFQKVANPTDFPHLEGRTAVVTGGAAGIGFHISRLLSQHGARVVIACRSQEEGEEAVSEILQEQPNAKVHFLPLDLASFQSVWKFVDQFLEKGWPLHLLVNNAGVMLVPYHVTEDGNEYHLQVNHLSHALLTSLLLPTLEKCATPSQPAHVVSVTSAVHWVASLYPETFGQKCEGGWAYSPHNAYALSKLAIILHTKALSRCLTDKQSNVVVTAVHPGVVNSSLYKHLHWTVAWAFCILRQLLFLKPEQAAVGVLATIPCGVSGCYYSNGRPSSSSPQSNCRTDQDTVYRKTCKMVGQKVD